VPAYVTSLREEGYVPWHELHSASEQTGQPRDGFLFIGNQKAILLIKYLFPIIVLLPRLLHIAHYLKGARM
jgi:hypothetical protein